jgi:ribosomal protein L12E/L44/L45/RPP1/RPP2
VSRTRRWVGRGGAARRLRRSGSGAVLGGMSIRPVWMGLVLALALVSLACDKKEDKKPESTTASAAPAAAETSAPKADEEKAPKKDGDEDGDEEVDEGDFD